MQTLYEPRGAALEYAPLAVNLYRGCAHRCRYCYAPGCLRMGREEFATGAPRPGILEELERIVRRRPGRGQRTLLCFSCDPYQPAEAVHRVTRRAIELLGWGGYAPCILTKSALAARDFDVMQAAGAEFGMSLVWRDDAKRAVWEPGASSVGARMECLTAARAAGLRTWVSVEPVIEAAEGMGALEVLVGRVDKVKIGKLNHHAELERGVDWPGFVAAALAVLAAGKQPYYIKRELWGYATPATRARYPQSRE